MVGDSSCCMQHFIWSTLFQLHSIPGGIGVYLFFKKKQPLPIVISFYIICQTTATFTYYSSYSHIMVVKIFSLSTLFSIQSIIQYSMKKKYKFWQQHFFSFEFLPDDMTVSFLQPSLRGSLSQFWSKSGELNRQSRIGGFGCVVCCLFIGQFWPIRSSQL